MKIDEQLKHIKEEIDMFSTASIEELDKFRLKYLGKKGILTCMFDNIREIAPEERKEFGKNVNGLKTQVLTKVEQLKETIENNKSQTVNILDLSRPANSITLGSRHPISKVMYNICQIFQKIGFTIADGPEIEDDWHNFESLNFPQEHPARDMQDTFFINTDPDIVLRTHTSSIQVRVMENNQPPIRVICP
ncbi:MAG: phenylalanine--tRNA ligase subunit alpha, partial [Bacteroidales bacterium]|nr:phenylalanine--tRNA ligase subunit alpha [Bacteroidales bacterium]